jgi:hypothetical protein
MRNERISSSIGCGELVRTCSTIAAASVSMCNIISNKTISNSMQKKQERERHLRRNYFEKHLPCAPFGEK